MLTRNNPYKKRTYVKIGETRAQASQRDAPKGTTQLIPRYYAAEIPRSKWTREEMRQMAITNGVGRPPNDKPAPPLQKVKPGEVKKDKEGGVEIGVPTAHLTIKQSN